LQPSGNNVQVDVLFVTSRVPGRHYRGDQLRAFHHIVQLGTRHRITLLAFDPLGDGAQIDQLLRERCQRIVVVPYSGAQMAWHALRGLASGLPFQVEAYNARSVREEFDRAVEAVRFDLVHLQLIRLGTLAQRARDLPVVMDFVDALSLNMTRRCETDRGALRRIAGVEARRLARYERYVANLLSATTISSRSDRLEINAPTSCVQVDNGVELQRFAFVESGRADNEIVFVGNLGYFPNVDAVEWFVCEVWPTLLREFPRLRLKLVGARPAASLAALAKKSVNVELIGPVSDVHPHLSRATLAIAPLRAGSGQQLKILEAMASGTPVVATTVAAAGIDAVDREHLLVTTDAAAMAHAIARLLSDATQRATLARAARVLVETRYTWTHSANALEAAWTMATKAQAAHRTSAQDEIEHNKVGRPATTTTCP
jgi:polysaccharide biosynthesis protein PslH